MNEIDTMNKWGVSLHPATNTLVMLIPPQRLTPDEALLLAAWLVSMSEFLTETQFEDVLKAVQNT